MKIRLVIVWLVLTVAAFAQSGPFAPSGGSQNLRLQVTGDIAFIGTTPTTISPATVLLTANTTNYVYVDLVAATITSNVTGFTSTMYPVATATTNGTQVTVFADVRPVAFSTSGNGGVSTSAAVIA